MKKKGFITVCSLIAVLVACVALFVGCFDKTPVDTTPKTYTIQYTDDAGTHQLTVTEGMPYSLNAVPMKDGYEFAGLYDAETGGTQYVSATGASLAPFSDGKNVVLFPQFKAKEYTVILDYQGAAVTGDRQLTVAYGSSLPTLPKDLKGEHKQFTGWYTKENCEGTQVADGYGLLPVVSVLNAANFDLSGEYIYLYAGFEIEKFTVTCHFGSGTENESLRIEYDTPVSGFVPKTRVDGKAPLTWSKTQGGEVYNGKVTENIDLYAVEYAPVIELDVNGGNQVYPVVARAGSTIVLPTPTKDLAKFNHWEDMQGNEYTDTTMPDKSISLKAVWQAKLVFDENGGSDVDDVSVAAGEKITLPMPEKEGFLFAGWYKADKEKYTSTTMPSAGMKLKAGWYKEKSTKVVKIKSTEVRGGNQGSGKPDTYYLCYEVDCGQYFKGTDEYYNVRIEANVKIKGAQNGSLYTAHINVYSQNQTSSSYLLEMLTFEDISDRYKDVQFTITETVNDNFYLSFWSTEDVKGDKYDRNYIYLSDFYFTMYYPDITYLYL